MVPCYLLCVWAVNSMNQECQNNRNSEREKFSVHIMESNGIKTVV